MGGLMTLERETQIIGIYPGIGGGWLVGMNGRAWEDLTPIESYDAFSNLAVAKRYARKWAREAGYSGAFRWTMTGRGTWYLSAMYDEAAERKAAHRRHLEAYGMPTDWADEDDEVEDDE
jgi:hypothetical protein